MILMRFNSKERNLEISKIIGTISEKGIRL